MERLVTDHHPEILLPGVTGNAMVATGSGMLMAFDEDDLQLEPIVDLDETAEAEQVSTRAPSESEREWKWRRSRADARSDGVMLRVCDRVSHRSSLSPPRSRGTLSTEIRGGLR